MKTKLLIAFFFCTCVAGYSQSLEMYYNGNVITDGQTIKITEIDLLGTMKAPFYVKNKTNASLDVNIKREVISRAPNSEDTYCWQLCWNTVPETDDYAKDIPANSTTLSTETYAAYTPAPGSAGSTTIKYTFSVVGNPNDKVSVIYTFSFNETGIASNKISQNFKIAVIDKQLQVNYDAVKDFISNDSQLRILSVTGKVMKTEKVNEVSGSTDVNLSGFSKGFYICTLVSGGKTIAVRKFVLK